MNEIKEAFNEAFSKYTYLQKEVVFLEIHGRSVMINWCNCNDKYISYYRVKQIAKFLHNKLPNVNIYDGNCKKIKF